MEYGSCNGGFTRQLGFYSPKAKCWFSVFFCFAFLLLFRIFCLFFFFVLFACNQRICGAITHNFIELEPVPALDDSFPLSYNVTNWIYKSSLKVFFIDCLHCLFFTVSLEFLINRLMVQFFFCVACRSLIWNPTWKMHNIYISNRWISINSPKTHKFTTICHAQFRGEGARGRGRVALRVTSFTTTYFWDISEKLSPIQIGVKIQGKRQVNAFLKGINFWYCRSFVGRV